MVGPWRMLLVLASIGGVANPATAQTPGDHLTRCGDGGNRELAIAGCTAAIQSGQLSTDFLAKALFRRGLHYGGQGQYDRAIADFDQAIHVDPGYADGSSFKNAKPRLRRSRQSRYRQSKARQAVGLMRKF